MVKETAEATTQTDFVPEPEVAKTEVESKPEQIKTCFDAGRFCRTIFFSGLAFVTLLAFFTFFGGVEFNGQVPENLGKCYSGWRHKNSPYEKSPTVGKS